MNPKMRKAVWWAAGAILLLIIFLTGPRGPRETDTLGGFLPGNPRRGGELFFDHGCGRCHSIAGIGGKEAADLAHPGHAPADIEDIAGALWNHAPDMWESMKSAGIQAPSLTPEDVADVMAFLFATGYLEEQGDPGRGHAVLTSKKCRNCHPLGDETNKIAPDLSRWSSRANPILWSAALWNHAPEMQKEMEKQGMAWPTLSAEEVVDVLAYLRTLGNVSEESLPLPGNPRQGRELFRRSCSKCHKAEGEGGDLGPELDSGRETRTLAGLAAALWNHSPAMGERMSELKLDRPKISEQEMADLITYLFAIRYFERAGDRVAGERFYNERCGKCHGPGGAGKQGGGPDLRALGPKVNAVFLASTLWNHGPKMYEVAKEQGIEWPLFQGQEMHDLITYLRGLKD